MKNSCEEMIMLSASCYKQNIFKINVDQCLHLKQPVSRITAVDNDMTIHDLFYDNHTALTTDFKAWNEIKRVRSELDALTIGDVSSSFDGFNNV